MFGLTWMRVPWIETWPAIALSRSSESPNPGPGLDSARKTRLNVRSSTRSVGARDRDSPLVGRRVRTSGAGLVMSDWNPQCTLFPLRRVLGLSLSCCSTLPTTTSSCPRSRLLAGRTFQIAFTVSRFQAVCNVCCRRNPPPGTPTEHPA